MDQKLSGNRLHGLDALRAIAMFLGVLLHAAIAYKVVGLSSWPHDSFDNNYFWDYLHSLIHSFRMPLFYLIAGFFCRLLFLKIGQKAFIRHRMQRIVIPFIFSMIILLPPTIFPFILYKNLSANQGNWGTSLQLTATQVIGWNGMAHFWFLYYLIFYYILFVIFNGLLATRWLNKGVQGAVHWIRTSNKLSIGLLIVSIGGVFALLLLHKRLLFGVDTAIIPNLVLVSFYGLFFFVGCIINIRMGYFDVVKRWAYPLLVIGVIISIVVFYLKFCFIKEPVNLQSAILIKALFSIQCVVLVNGLLGFFLRCFTRYSTAWRYFSDASYWVYLIHLGLVAFFQVWLLHKPVLSVVKFSLIVVCTTVICLLSYHLFVRHTIIGRYLHGERKK